MAAVISSALASGAYCAARAWIAATCGAAADVPEKRCAPSVVSIGKKLVCVSSTPAMDGVATLTNPSYSSDGSPDAGSTGAKRKNDGPGEVNASGEPAESHGAAATPTASPCPEWP